jgi:quercetin dioxygenase-like cupin family protein
MTMNGPVIVSVFPPIDRIKEMDQPFKLGLWATDNMRVARWQLAPGQRIIAHAHPSADDLVVVLAGEGHYLSYDDATPPESTQYIPEPCKVVVPPSHPADDSGCSMIHVTAGHVIVAPQGTFHGLLNTGSEHMIAVVATGPDIDGTRYVAR